VLRITNYLKQKCSIVIVRRQVILLGDAMTGSGQSWKNNEQLNWEYGDLRLRALRYVYSAGGGMQAISLRGHLLLDIAVTQLLLANEAFDVGEVTHIPFWRKVKTVAEYGLISPDIRSTLSDIARIRNAHAHELETYSTFRQVHALWVRAREAGIEHRFKSNDEEVEMTRRITAMGELADRLFDPATEMAELCVELFSHIVFWNYGFFDLVGLGRTLADTKW